MLKFFHLILNLIEFSYKKRINRILKNYLPSNINVFFDIGAHHGETTIDMLKNFKIKNVYLFEPNLKNFHILKHNLSKKNLSTKIYLNNFALGMENKKSIINEVLESSSSTLNKININTDYYKRKKKILNFFSKDAKIAQSKIIIKSFKEFINLNDIVKIDFIKIDTEGYEYKVLKNIENYLTNVGMIQFEHHYDLMILKNYNFRDINNLMVKNNFKQVFKSKMKFRKSFEYIYINKEFSFE